MAQNEDFRHMETIEIGGDGWFTMLAGMMLDVFTPTDSRLLTLTELADSRRVDVAQLGHALSCLSVPQLLTCLVALEEW